MCYKYTVLPNRETDTRFNQKRRNEMHFRGLGHATFDNIPVFSFDKFTAANLDSFFSSVQNSNVDSTNKGFYPPYNIRGIEKCWSVIEIALAGFKKEELSVELEGDVLVVRGISSEETNKNEKYWHRGIAQRSFTKKFSLDKNMKIRDVGFIDGLLTIYLKYEIPEEQKTKKILIGDGKTKPTF
jgi:molecular chaperone IbpA